MRHLILALLLTTGCAASGPVGPPAVHFGEDECSRCRMIVGEARFCAATRLGDEVRIYDDLGELFEQPLRPGELAWVHDHETEAWIEARKASYVLCEKLKTPMGYGVVAFAEPARASVFAARNAGKVLSFEQMLAR